MTDRAAKLATSGRPGALSLIGAKSARPASAPPVTLVALGARDAIDDAANFAIAALAEVHGLHARIVESGALTDPDNRAPEISGAALVCLSVTSAATAAEIRETAGRVRGMAPRAKLMLGLWCAPDDASCGTLAKGCGRGLRLAELRRGGEGDAR